MNSYQFLIYLLAFLGCISLGMRRLKEGKMLHMICYIYFRFF